MLPSFSRLRPRPLLRLEYLHFAVLMDRWPKLFLDVADTEEGNVSGITYMM